MWLTYLYVRDPQGMGEPLQNLPAVLPALDILTAQPGLQMSPGRITVSTSGLVPQVGSRRCIILQFCPTFVGAYILHRPALYIFIFVINGRFNTMLLSQCVEVENKLNYIGSPCCGKGIFRYDKQ